MKRCKETKRQTVTPRRKKQRLGPLPVEASSIILNEDALSIVMKYLGPKELFRLAFCSKELASRVTTTMVVRAAMMTGGNSKITIEELYPLMKAQSIYPPSTLRSLRLVNGRKCERCFRAKVNHVRPDYGVFFCWNCITERGWTKAWKTNWVRFVRNPRYKELFGLPGVTAVGYGRSYYMWTRKYNASDEPAGPIVTYNDVERVANNAGVPVETILKDGPSSEEYREFIDIFQSSEEEAMEALRERIRRKKETKNRTAARKVESATKMLEKVKKLLDEHWRDFALEYKVKKDLNHVAKTPCLELKIPIVGKILEEYILAPSKAKKEVLSELASKINDALERIEKSGFAKFEFLSDKPFEQKLKQYCLEQFPDLKSIVISDRYPNDFMKYLSENDFFDALMDILGRFGRGLFFGSFLVGPSESERIKCLAESTYENELKELHFEDEKSKRKLYNQAYEKSVMIFEEIKSTAVEYITWFQSKMEEDKDKEITKFDKQLFYYTEDWVFNNNYVSNTTHSSSIPYLKERDFQGLAQMHHESLCHKFWN